jgi:MoxR-like ATPase
MLDAAQIASLTRIVRRVPIADHVADYALQLSRLTRRNDPEAPDFIRSFVMWGAGPRASQCLVLGAKARAVLMGRYFVTHEDVQAVAAPVLRHRIKTNFNADAEGVTADEIVRRLIETIPLDTDEAAQRGKLPNIFRSADAG